MRPGWKEPSSSTQNRRNFILSLLLLSVQFVYVGASSFHEENDVEMKFDFVPNYWDLVAQAMAYAKCWENEALPKLDEDSLIMKPADCRKHSTNENCTNCVKDVENMMPNSSSLFDNGPVQFFQGAEPPKPIFHCTSHIGVQKSLDKDFLSYFRMEYSPPVLESNLSLRNSDLLPRIFVVEKEVNGIWTTSSLQNFWLFGLETENQSTYRIRVTAVSPKHVYHPQLSSRIKLYDPTVHTEAPRNLRVVEKNVDLKKPRPSPVVLLRWESSSGNNASCDFDVHYMYDEPFKLERHKADDAFWVRLDTLGFGHDYTIKLMERFVGGRESDKAEIHFSIPSCLKMLNYSFLLCPPPSPRNIRVENDTKSLVRISWDPPLYQTPENKILSYEIFVDPYPIIHYDMSLLNPPKPFFKGSVNGNQTSLEIQNPSVKGQIRISIIAKTRGGPSIEAVHIYSIEDLTTARTLRNILIGAVVVAVMGVLIPGVIGVKYYYDKINRNKKRKEKFEQLEKEPLPTQQVDRYSSKWEIESGSLILYDVIGEGQFGLVRKGKLGKMTVAVKTLRKDGPGTKESEKFWEEFEILKGLEPHVHVVGLVGIVKDHVPGLVVEYCDGGDLKSHLKKVFQSLAFQTRNDKRRYSPCSSAVGSLVHLQSNEVRVQVCMVTNEAYFIKNEADCLLTTLDLLSYARQIACGMEFLASNKIIHRDLAARNILISGPSRTLKIADFGLSRDVYEQNFYKMRSNDKIPFKWLAVECLLQELYTTKSDVWSYGIVLYEIVTLGGNPYPGVDNMQIFDKLKEGYRMPKPDNCSEELYKLMSLCWEENSNLRPDFPTIRRKLEEMIENSNYVSYLNLVSGSTDDSVIDSRHQSSHLSS